MFLMWAVGVGRTSPVFSDAVRTGVVDGLDASAESVAYSKKKNRRALDRCSIIQGDIRGKR